MRVETTPEVEALLAELIERAAIVEELDGPQIEAWSSSLFPLFDEEVTPERFVRSCAESRPVVAALLGRAIAELADVSTAQRLHDVIDAIAVDVLPAAAQIGLSEATEAWRVHAPFGQSIVIGFTNPVELDGPELDDEVVDSRHSILVELAANGAVEDLQLAGAPADLVSEASEADRRVRVESISVDVAADEIIAAWPQAPLPSVGVGPGLIANQAFVRSRLEGLTGIALPAIELAPVEVDIRRGLDDAEFANANAAARSTLLSALGSCSPPDVLTSHHHALVGVIQGDGGEVTPREREALLWLEWADWLGAGIGLVRAGRETVVSGSVLVDFVNRCPEVSSSIDKADREYAEWAFDVGLDVLADAGVIRDGQFSEEGFAAIHEALAVAWA